MFDFQPGDVVLANIKNPIEDTNSQGKPRPAVLLYQSDPKHWFVAGLTSQSHYKSTRNERIRVYASPRNGLDGDGYLWSPKFTKIPRYDIKEFKGVVDEHLAEVLCKNTNITAPTAARLRAAALNNWLHAA